MARRKKIHGIKVNPTFITILGLVSVLGFLAIVLDSFQIFNLGPYISPFILIILGVGLIIEGDVKMIRKYAKNGLTSDETTHILAIVVGFISLSVGGISLLFIGFDHPVFLAVKGMIALFALALVVLEVWFID